MIDNKTIIICILLIIIILIIFYLSTKSHIAEYIIISMLSTFEIGNFELIDTKNNKTLLKIINDNKKSVPKVYISNKKVFFDSIYHDSEVGLGETYMHGIWYSDDLTTFLLNLQLNRNNKNIPKFSAYNFYNKNLDNDRKNIEHHYDVGNDFYETFLTDSLEAYTCAFWYNSTTTLEQAQLNKVNTVINKLKPIPGSKILDIGCGWGKIANYVSEHTKCHVTGITISDEQVKFGQQYNNKNNVTILKKDYRDLNTKYDYIYSIGILEHVRYENFDEFFRMIKRCLKPGGKFLLHNIVSIEPTDKHHVSKTFISKYIFPGGQIPMTEWIIDSLHRNNLTVVHTEFFGGQHYAKTLNEWNKNMLSKSDFIADKYSKELILKYEYYFKICEAAFTSGVMGIQHILITNDITVTVDNNFLY